jgi:amino acid adenylation domain-containing protein
MATPYLLHHLLGESADRRPEAVAVRLQEESLTYGQLEAESNRLAHALIGLGVEPGDRVGLHLGKSFAAIISLFAILKAGACYVPVEPRSPAARLADIVDQCEIRCLIASSAAQEKFADDAFRDSPLLHLLLADESAPSGHGHRGPATTSISDAVKGRPDHPPQVPGVDQDLAYVLFTSGSTGKPKGVMLSHLSALTFVNWAADAFHLGPEDRLSSHAPLNFDLSIFDIFAGIKAGAAISLIPERLSPFPLLVSELIERHRLTVWYSVPSVLTMMLMRGKLAERDVAELRLVLFAGEVFPVKHLRQLMSTMPDARFFNLYGPTETNVCTYHEVKTLPDTQSVPVPIGKACANTQVMALAESGELVTSPGTEGLLYVRGSTVMAGYCGRPAETAQAFVANPFAVGHEEKLYCTGDWVTLDEEGNYHLLGRRDHMIKTRGYRVELGEIESVLHTHPAILEAVAVALPHEELGNTIRAFVVPDGERSISEPEVKRYCGTRLPHYMVPEEIEIRASLPRTATDKIDRSRLRADSTRMVDS